MAQTAWGYMSVPSCQCVTPGLHTGSQDHNKGIFHQGLDWDGGFLGTFTLLYRATHSFTTSIFSTAFVHSLAHAFIPIHIAFLFSVPPLLTLSQGPLFLTVLPELGLDCTIKSWPPAWREVLEIDRWAGPMPRALKQTLGNENNQHQQY